MKFYLNYLKHLKKEMDKIEYLQRKNQLLLGELERFKSEQKALTENYISDGSTVENLNKEIVYLNESVKMLYGQITGLTDIILVKNDDLKITSEKM